MSSFACKCSPLIVAAPAFVLVAFGCAEAVSIVVPERAVEPTAVASRLLTAAPVGLAVAASNSAPKALAPASAVVFRFGMRGLPSQDFIASTTDPFVIDSVRQELQLPEQNRRLHVNGLIAEASKKANLRWSWQFVESKWKLAEVSIEVCDGRPSYVEDDLQGWIQELGQFCPVASYVKSEVTKPGK